jgi:hypothetical protein
MFRSRLRTSAALSAAVLSAVGLASSAEAQVKSLDVVMNANQWHQLAEVLAFETGSGINVAAQSAGGVATATSSGFSTNPTQANDANTNGAYGGATGSLWHSGVDPAGGPAVAVGQTWTVTFANPVSLDSVQVFGRTDCCQDRDSNLQLILRDAGGVQLFSQQFGIPDDDQEVTIAVPEPAGLGILSAAAVGLLARRSRRK